MTIFIELYRKIHVLMWNTHSTHPHTLTHQTFPSPVLMRMSTTYVSCNSNSLVLSSRLRENAAGRREERERSREEGEKQDNSTYISGSPREKFNTIPLYSVSGSPGMYEFSQTFIKDGAHTHFVISDVSINIYEPHPLTNVTQ